MRLQGGVFLEFRDHDTKKYQRPILIFLGQIKMNVRFSVENLLKSRRKISNKGKQKEKKKEKNLRHAEKKISIL